MNDNLIINLGVHFTNKCNFQCDHCMFSCSPYVEEDRDELFNLAYKIKKFLGKHIYRLNLYGGESFFDLQLVKEYIDKLVDEKCIYFSIPTNGYFLSNDNLLEQIDNMFKGKFTKEKSNITISTSEWHQKQWSEGVKNTVNNINILKEYNNLYPLLEIQNTFTTQKLIPYGRAKQNKLKCVSRKVRCDLFENDDKHLEIYINPSGDISFCDFGYIIGNIDNFNIEQIINIKNKSYNKNKYKIFKDSSYVCKKCMKGKYIYE